MSNWDDLSQTLIRIYWKKGCGSQKDVKVSQYISQLCQNTVADFKAWLCHSLCQFTFPKMFQLWEAWQQRAQRYRQFT